MYMIENPESMYHWSYSNYDWMDTKHRGMYSSIAIIGSSMKLYETNRSVSYNEDSVQTNTEEREEHATSDRL